MPRRRRRHNAFHVCGAMQHYTQEGCCTSKHLRSSAERYTRPATMAYLFYYQTRNLGSGRPAVHPAVRPSVRPLSLDLRITTARVTNRFSNHCHGWPTANPSFFGNRRLDTPRRLGGVPIDTGIFVNVENTLSKPYPLITRPVSFPGLHG